VLRNDRVIVLAAVSQNGYALRFASKALKNDREIVLSAVVQYGGALNIASKELQNDREVVLFSVGKRMFKRFRWPRLVKTLLQFERDDVAFEMVFKPAAMEMEVYEDPDALFDGGDEVGPQPSNLWLAITNKKKGHSET